MSVEFICDDCEALVYAIGTDRPPSPARCSSCAWLADTPDPAERAALQLQGQPPISTFATNQ